jgi:hypothetical protein
VTDKTASALWRKAAKLKFGEFIQKLNAAGLGGYRLLYGHLIVKDAEIVAFAFLLKLVSLGLLSEAQARHPLRT